MNESRSAGASVSPSMVWVLVAAAGTFALTMGARQSMGLFCQHVSIRPPASRAGRRQPGVRVRTAVVGPDAAAWRASWPIASALAGCSIAGLLLLALGTALMPFMTSTLGLIFAIGVLAAGGAGMAGPAVLMAATTRAGAARAARHGGGHRQCRRLVRRSSCSRRSRRASPRQPAGSIALQSLAALTLLALPAAWVLRARGSRADGSWRGRCSASTSETVGAGPIARLGAAELPLALRGLLRLRLPRRLHRHAPARRGGEPASCRPRLARGRSAVIGLFNIVGSLDRGLAMGYQAGRWRNEIAACR